MYLQKLKLNGFRNYENLELEFNNNVNVFVGNNAHGKTNIIESIYISSITKSYRTGKDIECISFDKEFFRNEHIYIDDNGNKVEVEVYLDNNGTKQIKDNCLKVNKYSDFIGKIPLIVFSPDNMNIVKGSPNNRRRFLDILISQISKKYVICLQEYNKLIKLKNNILKLEKDRIDINYLDILDEKIAEKIEYISTLRGEFVDKVENSGKKTQEELSKGTECLKLKYISDFEGKNKEEVLNILLKSRENDIFRKTSNKSIAHDDFLILVNDNEVAKYGSQGQNRTALLSLKLAEFEILKEVKETVPIILLDDVFSELDKGRINYLTNYLKNYQVFITTTEIDSIESIDDKTIFKVQNGTVEKIKN